MTLMASLRNYNVIPVDLWGTEQYPADPEDIIFTNIKGDIILPISKFFKVENEVKAKTLDYFSMSTKRSYNSDVTRFHICNYLNYFEKFYDKDKELLMILYEIKNCMDFNANYNKQMFMNDINRYIIRNNRLYMLIRRFVEDNYNIHLSSNNNKTPNLQFEDRHAKVLYEISLMTNMYIPLATHFMYTRFIKLSSDIIEFMLELFDMCARKYEEEEGIYIFNKIYETAESVTNKSKNPDKIIWDKNKIRGVNTTTHVEDSVIDIILQIIPKYSYDKHIINFNYYSNRQCLKYKVTGIQYEFPFVKLSSSKRDEDNNSELDKYEARLSKKDEALLLQNKINCETSIGMIEIMYGPFQDDEIEFYRRRLTENGKPIINSFQSQLIFYLFFKDIGDPISVNSINQIDYIKLMIAAKRILSKTGMVILPYIISSKVIRVATRKNVSKKIQDTIDASAIYVSIKEIYNNKNIEAKILEFIGKVLSSSFEIIEYDTDNHVAGDIDKQPLPIINDIVIEELLMFITQI